MNWGRARDLTIKWVDSLFILGYCVIIFVLCLSLKFWNLVIPRAPLFVTQKAVFSLTADIRYYKGPSWAQEVPSPFLKKLSVGRKDLKIRK